MNKITERIPVYRELADVLREKIMSGEYRFGQYIPSERALSEKYGVTRVTLRKSIAILIQEGLLVSKPGKGTFVNRTKIDNSFDIIEGTTPFLMDQGLIPTTKILYTGTRKAGWKYAKLFSLSPEDELFELFRLRLGNNEPYILEYTRLPFVLIPGIEKIDFSVYSLSDLYQEYDIIPTKDQQTLELIYCYDPISRFLNVPEGEPIFMTTEVMTDQHCKVYEITRSYFSGNQFQFSTIMDK